MAHAQRDTWMALPGLAAVALRVRRGTGAASPPSAPAGGRGEETAPLPSPFRASLAEGLLWGAGVWMKPHVALMALAVWLLTAWRLAAEHPRPRRAAALDLAGNLVGGLVVGAAGLAWIVASGAWGGFYEVFTQWNPQYMKLAQLELDWRLGQELFWFPVWSLGLVVTVPLALFSVVDAAPWLGRRAASEPPRPGPLGYWMPRLLWDKQAGADARFARGVLGGLYLAWAAQSFFVQRGFQYAHVPETLLMMGLWASHRWAWVPLALLWLALTGGLWVAADYSPELAARLNAVPQEERGRFLPRHPVAHGSRLRLWPECWRTDLSDAERFELWDGLRLHPPHEASISWVELAEVADYLRARGARPGEVVAWFDSPHAVYLMLDTDPGIRFMHVYTALAICLGEDKSGASGRVIVMGELREAWGRGAKYAVNDLEWAALSASDAKEREAFLGPARSPADLLPASVPYPGEFPFNQPTLFRSRNGAGRYIVHLIVKPGDGPLR
jgi:hypothetical protein